MGVPCPHCETELHEDVVRQLAAARALCPHCRGSLEVAFMAMSDAFEVDDARRPADTSPDLGVGAHRHDPIAKNGYRPRSGSTV